VSLFFERPDFGERAVLVHLKLNSESEPEDPREFEELVISAGVIQLSFSLDRARHLTPSFLSAPANLTKFAQRLKAAMPSWLSLTTISLPAKSAILKPN